tara:strand:- start:3345 stop:3614 length:270 start_codon:yes stop_codon:yes gene_type:complete
MNIQYIYILLILLIILIIINIRIKSNCNIQNFSLIDKNTTYWEILDNDKYKEYVEPVKSAWSTLINNYKLKKPNDKIKVQYKDSSFLYN